MDDDVRIHQHTRRAFLGRATALGAASLLGLPRTHAEPAPEVTRVRLIHNPTMCMAPQYLAEELLRLEGFAQVEYIEQGNSDPDPSDLVASDRADFTMDGATALVPKLDRGQELVVLAGIHGGCFELFAHDHVRGVSDLKDRRIAVWQIGGADQVYLATIMAYVGLNPRTDVKWIAEERFEGPMNQFIAGNTDAFLAFPPQPQMLRGQQMGRVILDTVNDKPWSQYFCCMLAGNRGFVRRHPVATKRVLRAMLRASSLCASDPEYVARYMVAKGYEETYQIAIQVMHDLHFDAWRNFDPEATLRFFALRLREVGIIRSNPMQIIERGADFGS